MRLMNSIVVVVLVSLLMLYAGGMLVDSVLHIRHSRSFFAYEVRMLGRVPYWFLATLAIVFANGIMIPRYARYIGRTDFSPFRQYGQVNWNIPVQPGLLFSRNLVLVVGLLVIFMVAQAARL